MNPITYPARPVNGGQLDLAPPKVGKWAWEPKVNGWRALVHGPSRTAWNRKGEPLSIAKDLMPAINELQHLSNETYISWWDCEALARRHEIGKGGLVVLDWVPVNNDIPVPWRNRKDFIMRHVQIPVTTLTLWEELCEKGQPLRQRLFHLPDFTEEDARERVWQGLQEANQRFDAPFYEGVVAKRVDSLYPVQLNDPEQHCLAWMKHRWAY